MENEPQLGDEILMSEEIKPWVVPDGAIPVLLLHYAEVSDNMGIFLNPTDAPDAESWGALFASISQIIANHACQFDGSYDPTPFLEKLKLAFLFQMDQPIPPDLGTKFSD